MKLINILKTILKEAAPTVDDYAASLYGKGKDQPAAGYSARSTGGTTIDRTPRKDMELGKGKGHEGWFDDEIQFDQELKSIVDRYHKKAAMMKSRGTSTRADVRGGKQGWQPRDYIIKLPTGSWEEFLTDKRTLVNKLRKLIMKFVEQVTGPDHTGKPFEDLSDQELASWLKSFKVNSKDQTMALTIPLHAKPFIEKLLKGLYPSSGQKVGGQQNSVFIGFPHELEKRKQVNTTNVRRRETPAQKRRRIMGGDNEEAV